MAQIEVSFLDYIQVSIRFYISLIRYKVGNLIQPPLNRKRGELDDSWLERSSFAQAQRFVDYHRNYTLKSIAWRHRTNLEDYGKVGKDLKKALMVASVMALNRFDQHQRRINQRIFEEKQEEFRNKK